MEIKSLALVAALACGAAPAFASDQIVDLSVTPYFTATSPVLDGGSDVITFTGAASGTYNYMLTLSSQAITGLTASLNGSAATIIPDGTFTFAGLTSTTMPPFVLTLQGTAGAAAKYSGELTITPVPEPQTYALLLAGLGVLGFVSRRRTS